MATANTYAAGTLPPDERARYAAFLSLHPQLGNYQVLEAIAEVMQARGPIAHPTGQARCANSADLKTEIVQALEAGRKLDAEDLQVVDDLVQELMLTPVTH